MWILAGSWPDLVFKDRCTGGSYSQTEELNVELRSLTVREGSLHLWSFAHVSVAYLGYGSNK